MRKNLVRLSATTVLALAITPAFASHSIPPISSKLIDNRIEALDPDIGSKIIRAVQGMNLPYSAPIRLTLNHSGKVVAVDFLDNQIDKADRDKAKRALSSMSFGMLPFNPRAGGSLNLVFTIGDLVTQQRLRPGSEALVAAAETVTNRPTAAAQTVTNTLTIDAHGTDRPTVADAQAIAREAAAADSVEPDKAQLQFDSEIKTLYTDFKFSRLDAGPSAPIFGGIYETPVRSDESDKQEQELTKQGESLRQQGRLNASMISFLNASVYPLRLHDTRKAEAHIDQAVSVALEGTGQNRRYLREAMLAYANALLQFSSDNKLQGAELLFKKIDKLPFSDKDRRNAKFEIDILKSQRKLYQRQQQNAQAIQVDKKIAAKCISMKPVEFTDAMEAYRDIESIAQTMGLTDEARDASQKCLSLIEEEYDINSIQLLPELANLILIAEQNHYRDESKYLQKRITEVVDSYVQPVAVGQLVGRETDAARGATAVLNSLSRLQYTEGGNLIHSEALETLHRQVFKLKVKTSGCDAGALQTFCSFLQTEGKNDEAANVLTDACHYLEGSSDTNAKYTLRTARTLLVQALGRAGRTAEAADISALIAIDRKEEVKAQLAKDEEQLKSLANNVNPDYLQMAQIRIKIAQSMRLDKDEAGFQKQMPKIIELLEKIKQASPTVSQPPALRGFQSDRGLGFSLQTLMQCMVLSNQVLTADEQTFLVQAFSTVERQVPGSIDAQRWNVFLIWGRRDKDSRLEEKILTAVLKVRQERDGMHAASLRPIYESMVRADQHRGHLDQVVVHQKAILDLDRSNASEPLLIEQDYLRLAIACVQVGQAGDADRYFETVQSLLQKDATAPVQAGSQPAAQTTTPVLAPSTIPAVGPIAIHFVGRTDTQTAAQSVTTSLMADLAKTFAEHKQTEKADRILRLAMARAPKGRTIGALNQSVELAIARLVMNYSEANQQMKLIDLLHYAIDVSENCEGKDNYRAIQLRYKLANAYLMASREAGAESKAGDLMHTSEGEFDRIVQVLAGKDSISGMNVDVKNQQLQNFLTERLVALRNYGHEDEAKALEDKVHLEPLQVMPVIGAPIMPFFPN